MVRHIASFVLFVARGFPLFGLVLVTLLVLVFEYVCTSLMIPAVLR